MDGVSIVKQSHFRLVQTVSRVSFELECDVTLTEDALCWRWQPPPPDTKHRGDASHQPTEKSVRISWVLEPHVHTEKPSDPEDDPITKLVIHFVKRDNTPPEFKLSIDKVELYGPTNLCTEWVAALKDHLEIKVPERPRSLLVIINPSSGSKKGEKIFSGDVTPVFDLFKIKTDVKLTKVPGDTDAVLQDYDLTTVDGLVSVGGDGTHYSVCSALMKKTLQAAGVGEVTPSTELPKTSVRHGMIPAGTGNGGQLAFSYSKDPVTNAIVIALGRSKPQDVYTWHCGEEFIGYFLLGSAFGLLSQGLDAMETHRWAGPGRFVAAVFVALVKHAPVMLSIDYLPAQPDLSSPAENSATESALGDPSPNEPGSSPNDPSSSSNVPNSAPNDPSAAGIQRASGGQGDATVLQPGWKRITGKILELDAFAFSDMRKIDLTRCYMSEEDHEPGVFSVVITRPCGRMEHVKYMRKCIQGQMGQGIKECDFVECISVRECRVRVIPDSDHSRPLTRMSLDGEILLLPEPHFHIQGHPGIIPTFARMDGSELREFCEGLAS